jgi:hypothetical protein
VRDVRLRVFRLQRLRRPAGRRGVLLLADDLVLGRLLEQEARIGLGQLGGLVPLRDAFQASERADRLLFALGDDAQEAAVTPGSARTSASFTDVSRAW